MSTSSLPSLDDESVVTTYAQALKIVVQDMAAWGQSIMQRSWELKDAIDAAADEEALDANDIEIGWP